MLRRPLLILVCLLPAIFFGQEYQFDSDEFPGEVITKKGTVRKGYIDMRGNNMIPWANQTSVKFFSEDAIADGKLKGKEKEKFKFYSSMAENAVNKECRDTFLALANEEARQKLKFEIEYDEFVLVEN